MYYKNYELQSTDGLVIQTQARKYLTNVNEVEYDRWRFNDKYYRDGEGYDSLYKYFEKSILLVSDIKNDIGWGQLWYITVENYCIIYSTKYNIFISVGRYRKNNIINIEPTKSNKNLAWDSYEECWC